MRKFKFFTTALAMLLVLVSCGSGKGKVSVEESLSEFADDSLSQGFYGIVNIAEGDYELVANGNTITTTFTLVCKGSMGDETEALLQAIKESTLIITLVDKDGTEISGADMKLDGATMKDVITWAMSSGYNSKKEYKFSMTVSDPDEVLSRAAKILVRAKGSGISSFTESDDSSMEITSDVDEDENVEEDGSNVEEDGSEDWDAVLDSYDEYVTKYIALVQKASNGDMDALSEYPQLMEEAKELGEKLQNAKGTLSAEQWARYTKILKRMTDAAQKVQ